MEGTYVTVDGKPAVRFERALGHPVESVWEAVTDPERLAHWFPTTVDVDLREGGAMSFAFPGGEAFEGEVLAFEPDRLWEIRWGTDTIRVEVQAEGDGTLLTLLDTIDELGKAARDGAGWHVCLDRLAHRLDGSEPGWSTSDRWREVHPWYVEELGPEASTIGPPEGALG
jgi:uncharacterized protein YndB with AHSA1/START domain